MNPDVPPSESPSEHQERNRKFGHLPTMDNIVFYQPPLASTNQPPRFAGVPTASIAARGSAVSADSTSVRQTASQLDQQNEIWKDHITKHRDLSDLFQSGRSSNQHCRNDALQETVQDQGTCGDCCYKYCVSNLEEKT